MGLHTARTADWDKETGPRNIWQKIASKSYGTLTPANFASFAGGILAIYGLFVVVDGEVYKGLALVTIGRIADLVDGVIAEYTKTKSPLGETIDVLMDKVVMVTALIVFAGYGLVPWFIVGIVALQNLVNIIIGLMAKLRKKKIHPSRYGKVATALSWVALILYPLGDWIRQESSDGLGTALILLAVLSFVVYIVIGLRASLSYAYLIYKRPSK